MLQVAFIRVILAVAAWKVWRRIAG